MARRLARALLSKSLASYCYARLRHPKRWGFLPGGEKQIVDDLGRLGIPIQDIVIDIGRYKDYYDRAGYSGYTRETIIEKSLEHFIAQELLELNPTDVYIDIASNQSPVPEIYQRLYGCRTYVQDLSYTPGIHGNKIGSNAASLPLPDASVTKMALHCSFEHFEGDSDSRFIKEAARVLRIGGKAVIVPLYLAPRYAIATDLMISRVNRVRFEPDALVMAVKGWNNRHGRFYDADHLVRRVLNQTHELAFTIFRLTNTKEIDETVHARFGLIANRV